MGCRLNDFKIGKWETVKRNGHKVEIASATTVPIKGFPHVPTLKGVVYKVDGVFQGFTGSKDAALYWVDEKQKRGVL